MKYLNELMTLTCASFMLLSGANASGGELENLVSNLIDPRCSENGDTDIACNVTESLDGKVSNESFTLRVRVPEDKQPGWGDSFIFETPSGKTRVTASSFGQASCGYFLNLENGPTFLEPEEKTVYYKFDVAANNWTPKREFPSESGEQSVRRRIFSKSKGAIVADTVVQCTQNKPSDAAEQARADHTQKSLVEQSDAAAGVSVESSAQHAL